MERNADEVCRASENNVMNDKMTMLHAICFCTSTPLKINMLHPKNEGLEDENPFQTGDFQLPC